MTEIQGDQSVREDQSQHAPPTGETVASDAESETEAPPEPWTPERVTEWNNYFDVYVMLAALLLIFVASCNYVTDAHLWLHLRTGQVIADQMAPVTTDIYSYTQSDQSWVNLPWLFQWCACGALQPGLGACPGQPGRYDRKPGRHRANRRRRASSCSAPWCGWRRPWSCSGFATGAPVDGGRRSASPSHLV